MADRVSGIYAIISPSGKRYVGSSVDVAKRWRAHRRLLAKGRHHCIGLQRAYAKYGAERLDFVLMEECGQENLVSAEQRIIDELWSSGSLYNRCPTAGSTFGFRHSAESRSAMSSVQKERRGTLEAREAQRELVKSLWKRPEYVAAQRSSAKARWAASNLAALFSKMSEERWADPVLSASMRTVMYSNNTSGFRGVKLNKATNRFEAGLMFRGVKKFLGSFSTAEEANAAVETYLKDPAAGDAEILSRRANPKVKSSSGFKGVYFFEGRWAARPYVNGKSIHAGYFDTPEEANAARLAYLAKLAESEKEAA